MSDILHSPLVRFSLLVLSALYMINTLHDWMTLWWSISQPRFRSQNYWNWNLYILYHSAHVLESRIFERKIYFSLLCTFSSGFNLPSVQQRSPLIPSLSSGGTLSIKKLMSDETVFEYLIIAFRIDTLIN